MNVKKLDGLIFDLDRTLYDRFSTLRGIAFLLKRERADWFPESLSAYELGEALAQADYWLIYRGWPAVYRYLEERGIFQNAPGCEMFQSYILDDGFCRVAVPYPETGKLLETLRGQGYRLGVITNGPGFRQRQKLALLGLTDTFEEILISGEFGKNKPDPSIFLEMSRRLEIPAERLAFVGDSMDTDIVGANQAGMYAIRVKTSPDWHNVEAVHADCAINDIFELPGLLERLERGTGENGKN